MFGKEKLSVSKRGSKKKILVQDIIIGVGIKLAERIKYTMFGAAFGWWGQTHRMLCSVSFSVWFVWLREVNAVSDIIIV